MAFCHNCGQQLPENANACPNCGTFVNAQAAPEQAAPEQAAPEQAAPQQAAPQQAAPQQAAPQQAAPQQVAPQPAAPLTPEEDVQQSRGIAWLSYMGLLFLIPMFVKKQSPYCQFHVKQGATLCAVEIAYSIATSIVNAIFNAILYASYGVTYALFSVISTIFSIAFSAGSVFLLVIAIIGIVNAATGKKTQLPLISKIPWIANLLDKFYQSA